MFQQTSSSGYDVIPSDGLVLNKIESQPRVHWCELLDTFELFPLHEVHTDRAILCRPSITTGLLKRLFDIVVSLPLLLISTPVLVLSAFLIVLTSPGSPFFLQRRIGLRGKPFLIIKLRTMTTRDDGARISQATRTDGRITMIGGLLRRTSIDELPQLLNVLIGDMSIVGPRPHAIAHDRQISQVAYEWHYRQWVRPGITGLAQVNGCRGEFKSIDDVRRRARWDARYVAKWSLWLDIRILIQTLILPFTDRNAV